MICICFFTVELLLKLIVCPNKREFLGEFLTWVDILAIAPFFITLIIPSTRYNEVSMGFAVLRVMRLLHIFEILKITQYSRGLQTLGLTFYAGFRELLLLITVVILLDLLFAVGIYLAEYNMDHKFKSIPDALWFGLITMTTVGYGDMIPETTWGRLIACIAALSGLLVISLPIPVIVKNFKHFYKQECQLEHVNDFIDKESDKAELAVTATNWLKR